MGTGRGEGADVRPRGDRDAGDEPVVVGAHASAGEIGGTLRSARQERGRSLEELSAVTRIRPAALVALEEERFDALGGDVYVKGFLRSYGRELGLDPEPLVAAYRERGDGPQEPPVVAPARASAATPLTDRRPPVGLVAAAVTGAVVLLVLALAGLLGRNDPEGATAVAPPPASDAPAAATADREAGERAAARRTPQPPPTDGVRVAVTVTGERSWLRVAVDGVAVFEGMAQGGSTRTFEGDEAVALRVGDASAVSLSVNGRDQGTLGGEREVVDVQFTAP